MFTSFSTALSALRAHTTAVDVVGNNLANLNTVGFKQSTVAFHDLISQNLGNGASPLQVGFGVGRPTTMRQFTQGAITTTGAPLDVAIEGSGFLVVKDSADKQLFTRAGNLQLDREGTLLTATGEKVQGWTERDGVLNTNKPEGNIVIPAGSSKPGIATSEFSFDMNLNASKANPSNNEFSTSIEVYDSLGMSHVVTATFERDTTTPNTWNYSIDVPADTTTSAFTPVTGSLSFGPDGKLTSPAASDGPIEVDITGLANATSDLKLKWNLYDGVMSRITQFSQPSDSTSIQNGSPASQLTGVSLGDEGMILAQYSDGQQKVVGQLAMASIRNPESMIAAGNNNFQLSAFTASPAVGLPGAGGRGGIVGGSLESSTVDIAREFTNLMVYQRGYQANSRVITTADELSQETINLKR